MPYGEDHGGSCCGITHWVDFGPRASEDRLRSLDRLIDPAKRWKETGREGVFVTEGKRGFSHLFEVVLTDSQMITWAPELKKRGFKLMHRFYNSNSGNYCNVLFFNAHGPRGRNRLKAPYTW